MSQMTVAGKNRMLAWLKKKADREWAKGKQGEGGWHFAWARKLYQSVENVKKHKPK